MDHKKEDFPDLVADTTDMVFSLGMRLFRNEEDALDFSQEVYMQAYQKYHTFRGDSKFSTWLYSLGLNYGLNKLKKEKRLKTDQPLNEDILVHNPQDDDPLDQLEGADFNEWLQEKLNELPDLYRIPLILFYFDKLSYEEIAKKLDLKEGTLKSYLHRAKKLLRNSMGSFTDPTGKKP